MVLVYFILFHLSFYFVFYYHFYFHLIPQIFVLNHEGYNGHRSYIDQRYMYIDHLLNVIVEYVFLLSWTVNLCFHWFKVIAMITNFVTS